MKADKSNPKSPVKSKAEEKPLFLFVPVSDEIRRLAKQLEAAFAQIYPVVIASKRRAAAVFLKLPDEHSEDARKILAYLGTCLTHVLPPSFEDYYHRHETRQKVMTGLQEKGAEIVLDSSNSLSDAPPGRDDQAGRDLLRQKLGDDPLEHPLWVLRPDFPAIELMIFLEQYLPSGLEEIPGDIANTQKKFCQLPFVLLSLLEAFRMGFRGIDVVRADFIFPERELYPDVDRAHALLLQLAEIIGKTATPTLPHLVTIIEQGDELAFTVDQTTVLLTPTMKEAFVALSILGSKGPFPANRFAELAPSEKSDAAHNFENKMRLLKPVLPRLSHRSEKGNRILENIIFVSLPTDGCLEKHLYGCLAADE